MKQFKNCVGLRFFDEKDNLILDGKTYIYQDTEDGLEIGDLVVAPRNNYTNGYARVVELNVSKSRVTQLESNGIPINNIICKPNISKIDKNRVDKLTGPVYRECTLSYESVNTLKSTIPGAYSFVLQCTPDQIASLMPYNKSNIRNASKNNPAFKAMVDTLVTDPAQFMFSNLGVSMTVDAILNDPKSKTMTICLDALKPYQGVNNGGHTILACQEALSKMSSSNALIQLNIVCGLTKSQAIKASIGKNTSKAPSALTLANASGDLDSFKEALSKSQYINIEDIAFYDNDYTATNSIKSVTAIDIGKYLFYAIPNYTKRGDKVGDVVYTPSINAKQIYNQKTKVVKLLSSHPEDVVSMCKYQDAIFSFVDNIPAIFYDISQELKSNRVDKNNKWSLDWIKQDTSDKVNAKLGQYHKLYTANDAVLDLIAANLKMLFTRDTKTGEFKLIVDDIEKFYRAYGKDLVMYLNHWFESVMDPAHAVKDKLRVPAHNWNKNRSFSSVWDISQNITREMIANYKNDNRIMD